MGDNGVKFQKKPDDGRMKGLAFALDLDGYWIEICRRKEGLFKEEFNYSQTMMRVKDGWATLEFYQKHLGMRLVRVMEMPQYGFTNFFLVSLTDAEFQKEVDLLPEEEKPFDPKKPNSLTQR